MSDDLRTALDTAAHTASLPRVAPDLWQQGRRRRKLRRIGQVAAVLTILAIVVMLPRPSTPDYAPAEPDKPATIGNHVLWQRMHSESPNGPAMVTYLDDGTVLEENVGVIVGSDGSYRRLDPGGIVDALGTLSPAGRYLVQFDHQGKDKILDLATGDRLQLPIDGWNSYPVAWAADSRYLLFLDRYDNSGEAPMRPDELKILDVVSGKARLLFPLVEGMGGAAFSPDGRHIAWLRYTQDAKQDQVVIMETDSGVEVRSHPVAKGQGIAGSAAWTPDGKSVGLITDAECLGGYVSDRHKPWRIRFLDVQSGKVDDRQNLDGRMCPVDFAGWRDGKAVFTGPDLKLERSTLYTMEPGEKQEVLLVAPEGARSLLVARDFAEHGTFRDTAANPLAASFTTYACVLISPALVVLLIVRSRRRARV